MPRLEIISGDQAQHQFLVEKVGVWIGSDERCDLRLEEPGISRFHAQIIKDPNGDFWVEDAGSSFGTLLNGNDVEREILKDQDMLTLGRVKLRFLADAPIPSIAPDPRSRELHTQPQQGLEAPADLFEEEPPPPHNFEPAAASNPQVAAAPELHPPPPAEPQPVSSPLAEAFASQEDDDDYEEILDGDDLILIEDSEFDLEAVSPEEAAQTPGQLPSVSQPSNPFALSQQEVSYPHPVEKHPQTPTQNEMTQSADLASLMEGVASEVETDQSQPEQVVVHEGTQLAPIPLTPEEFLRPKESPSPVDAVQSSVPTPNPFAIPEEALEVEDEDFVIDNAGTQLSRMPIAPAGYKTDFEVESVPSREQMEEDLLSSQEQAIEPSGPMVPPAIPIPVPPPSVVTEIPSETIEPDDDLEADLMGAPPPPRSRTVMFNLELEKLKHQLLEREKQLNSLKDEMVDRNQDFHQNEWLQQTLEMVQEDNKRLQYQISAYEEAAEENEQLIQQVEHLLKENKQLAAQNHQLASENHQLRDTIAQYEQYFYQHGGGQ